jgi:hypothetical protein
VGAGDQEPLAFLTTQNTLDIGPPADSEKVPGRNLMSGVLDGEKPTELAD